MTDNEKAATFIGWDPLKCSHCGHPMAEHEGYLGCAVERCNDCVDYYPDNPAPDMSKPENYMRALEDFYYFSHRNPSPWALIQYKTDKSLVIGSTIVEALAALYDAGHGDAS